MALVDALETKSVIEHLGHYGVTVELGPKLEMTVFAEETETQGQLERLRHLGRGSARATSSHLPYRPARCRPCSTGSRTSGRRGWRRQLRTRKTNRETNPLTDTQSHTITRTYARRSRVRRPGPPGPSTSGVSPLARRPSPWLVVETFGGQWTYGAHDTVAALFMPASGFPFTVSGPEAISSNTGASVPPSLMCPAW